MRINMFRKITLLLFIYLLVTFNIYALDYKKPIFDRTGTTISPSVSNDSISTTGTITGGTITASNTIQIPCSSDPDVSVQGQISQDNDSANEVGDVSIRGFDGTNQFLVSRKLRTLEITVTSPALLADPDLCVIWHNTSGMTFNIVEWKAWSDTDAVTLNINEITDQTDFTAITLVDAVEISTSGTGVYYASDTTMSHSTIEQDHLIALDFDQTDVPNYVKITIVGWYDANVD